MKCKQCGADVAREAAGVPCSRCGSMDRLVFVSDTAAMAEEELQVLAVVRQEQEVTAAQLAAETKLIPSQVDAVLSRLSEAGVLRTVSKGKLSDPTARGELESTFIVVQSRELREDWVRMLFICLSATSFGIGILFMAGITASILWAWISDESVSVPNSIIVLMSIFSASGFLSIRSIGSYWFESPNPTDNPSVSRSVDVDRELDDAISKLRS